MQTQVQDTKHHKQKYGLAYRFQNTYSLWLDRSYNCQAILSSGSLTNFVSEHFLESYEGDTVRPQSKYKLSLARKCSAIPLCCSRFWHTCPLSTPTHALNE